jgi:hypothetical protein
MCPPRNVTLVLEQYKRELLKEINSRPDIKVSENTERQPTKLTGPEIAEAIDRAAVLRSMKPRYGVQVILGEYLLALMLEQSQRSKAKLSKL